jgi:phage-related protein
MVQEFYLSGTCQTLEQLASKLDDTTEQRRRKTMIRRLYDITNVFKAIGLVRKTIGKDRSVAIEWLGRIAVDLRSGWYRGSSEEALPH